MRRASKAVARGRSRMRRDTSRPSISIDIIPMVLAPERVGADRAVVAQIVEPKEAAMRIHVGGDLLGDLAAVEDVRPAPGDPLEGACEFRILNALAEALGASVALQVDTPSCRAEAQ